MSFLAPRRTSPGHFSLLRTTSTHSPLSLFASLSSMILSTLRRTPLHSRYMSLRPTPSSAARSRLAQMTSHFSSDAAGVSLAELPKSNVFTTKLPPDPAFETPEASHKAPRETLGPRLVRGALYTYVRPETTDDTELLGVSPRAMQDIGLKPGEEQTPEFRELVSGNKFYWSEENGGIYPWAQCYGGETSPLSENTWTVY